MGAVSEQSFCDCLLSALLELAADPIPNVRIVFLTSLNLTFFQNERNQQRIDSVISRLATDDKDKDVLLISRRMLSQSTDDISSITLGSDIVSTEC